MTSATGGNSVCNEGVGSAHLYRSTPGEAGQPGMCESSPWAGAREGETGSRPLRQPRQEQSAAVVWSASACRCDWARVDTPPLQMQRPVGWRSGRQAIHIRTRAKIDSANTSLEGTNSELSLPDPPAESKPVQFLVLQAVPCVSRFAGQATPLFHFPTNRTRSGRPSACNHRRVGDRPSAATRPDRRPPRFLRGTHD